MMQGIFGWLGNLPSADDAPAVLDAMARAFGGASAAGKQLETGAALGHCGPRSRAWRQGQRLLVVCGFPEWQGRPLDRDGAEALLSAYGKDPEALLETLHGSFALAILDTADHSALLAVDRLGIEPLAFQAGEQRLLFSSRADSLARHPFASRELDPQSLYDYLYFHCVPSPRTIFRGQSKLLPGEYLQFRTGKAARRGFYWRLHYQDRPAAFGPLRDEFRALLRRCVTRATHGDERPGAFLSGGTDSSTVLGHLCEVLGRPADSYSIGFAAEGYDEMEYARIAARHFGARPHEYYVTPGDVAGAVPRVAAAYDEPFGNASAVPAYFCARMAAEDGVRTLLAGDGGDELFAGNSRYLKQKMLELYQGVPGPLRRGLLEPLAFSKTLGGRGPLRKLRSYIEHTRVPLPDRLEAYNFLHRTPPGEMFDPGFLAQIDVDEPLELIRDPYRRADTDSYLNRMLHLELKTTLADNDLRKVNRMCDLAGVQVHYPMLDEEMVAFSARVPPALKLRGFKLRYFFKASLEDYLPREILTKPKQGFGLPFGVWLQDHGPLQELAEASLSSFARRGILSQAYMDRLRRQHQDEHAAYYGVMIWVLMMLEQWLQANAL
ncbi:asparagine synthase-related protein [Thiohalobacter sp. IOR34]|uniref:asparagine synthetase B family protein n=1 Tax=Thiohalobacter sp. IOR34 TaxID=3057176 RepID=UPI0025AEEC68|nr:asparagine synthase-related protein [Thiohalobacter sp. IOR34]WJW74452.1 asparagine synthase-related protein [Thiohalobacter sp. IOR34]